MNALLRTMKLAICLALPAIALGSRQTPEVPLAAAQPPSGAGKKPGSDKPAAPAALPGAQEKLPADTAVLELDLPQGAQASLDGKDIGNKHRFVFEKLAPKQLDAHELTVKFAGGKQAQRTLLLQGGWHVRLPLAAAELLRPELVLQTGHTDLVHAVAFSPDGRQIVTASKDLTAILWDAQSGHKLRVFKGHTDEVKSVAFSPDGRQLLTGSGNTYGTITGSRDNTAILWDTQSGDKLRAFTGHASSVTSVAFSPDGRQVLTGSYDKTAVLWDAQSGNKLRVFKGHTIRVTSVAFGRDGRQVLTGSGDKTAILWDAQSGNKLRTFKGLDWVNTVAFSPDGRQVLTGSDKTATLWDAQSGSKIRAFTGHTWVVNSVAFSPDGRHVLTADSSAKTAILWDAQNGNKLRIFQGHADEVTSVAFSPDGQQVLTGSGNVTRSGDNTAILWDTQSGNKLRDFKGHTCWVYTVVFSPDGRHVLTGSGNYALTGSGDNTAILWDTQSGNKLRDFNGHIASVKSVAFRRDGRQVLTGSQDTTAILWDAQSGNKLRTFQGLHGFVESVAFSLDGRQVLTGSGDKAILWDAQSGNKLRTFEGRAGTVESAVFSPDGRQLLTGYADWTAILWDAQSGNKLRTFKGHIAGVESVAFSPDGRQVLTGSRDKTAILWDALSGNKLRAFAGHTGFVESVAFSPDGREVLTGSADQTATLWDVQNGNKLRHFKGHTHEVTSVAFSPDGRHVLTGSADGTSRLWDIATGNELAQLLHFDGGRDWAVVTPEGLFDGNRGGREKVSFRIGKGLDVAPLDRFFQDFYYPGLLAEIWRGERPLPGKPLPSNPAPSLKVLPDSQPGVGARPEQVSIDVAVTDLGGGIKGPWLQHNRAILRNGVHVKTEGKTAHYRFPVSLVPGDNRIEVRAATEDGGRESDPASLTIPFNGKLPEPELYVIAIGINRHAKGAGVTDLDCCVADSKAIAKLFQERSAKLYRNKVHVTPLLDGQATKENILQAIRDCASKAKPQDTLVVSISGHGVALGQRFYLIPHDFKLAQPQQPSETPRPTVSGVGLRGYREVTNEQEAAVRARGLAIDELGEVLAEVPALKRVLLFGTCHSGSAIQLASKQHNPFAFRGAVERFSRAQGVYSLSASKADELAAETKDLGHSLLTYALLAAVRAADSGPLKDKPLAGPQDSAIDVLRWFEYARTQVPGLYEQYVGRPQQIEISGDDQPTFPLFSRDAR